MNNLEKLVGGGLLISCHITCLEGVVAYLKGEEWTKDLLTPEIIEKNLLSVIKFLKEIQQANGSLTRNEIASVICQTREITTRNLLKDMEGFEEETRE